MSFDKWGPGLRQSFRLIRSVISEEHLYLKRNSRSRKFSFEWIRHAFLTSGHGFLSIPARRLWGASAYSFLGRQRLFGFFFSVRRHLPVFVLIQGFDVNLTFRIQQCGFEFLL